MARKNKKIPLGLYESLIQAAGYTGAGFAIDDLTPEVIAAVDRNFASALLWLWHTDKQQAYRLLGRFINIAGNVYRMARAPSIASPFTYLRQPLTEALHAVGAPNPAATLEALYQGVNTLPNTHDRW